jgi:hypothetical protein
MSLLLLFRLLMSSLLVLMEPCALKVSRVSYIATIKSYAEQCDLTLVGCLLGKGPLIGETEGDLDTDGAVVGTNEEGLLDDDGPGDDDGAQP